MKFSHVMKFLIISALILVSQSANADIYGVGNPPLVYTAPDDLTTFRAAVACEDYDEVIDGDTGVISIATNCATSEIDTQIYPSTIATVSGLTAALAAKATSASIPTLTSQLTNDSGFVGSSALSSYLQTSTAAGTYATITNLNAKFTTPAGTTAQYLRGDGSTATFPTIPTLNSQLTNDSNYITSGALSGYLQSSTAASTYATISSVSAKFNTPSGSTSQYLRGDGSTATFPSIPAAQVNSDWSASSGVAQIQNKPTIGKAYEGTTLRSGAFPIFKSATVSSGVAVVNLTDDGTSSGNALCTNGIIADSVNPIVSDATASYQMSWAFSNSNKTLTITANKLTTANILTGLLGQAAANSAVVKIGAWCY